MSNLSGSQFKDVYFLHEQGGSADGMAAKLVDILRPGYPDVEFHLPSLPHSDLDVTAQYALGYLNNQYLPFIKPGSLVVGLSMGGFIAAKMQEQNPGAFDVIAICSSTEMDAVRLEKNMDKRMALYSSRDQATLGRVGNWPSLTKLAFDVPWIQHDVTMAKYTVCYLIACYMRGKDMIQEVETLLPPEPKDK